MDFVDPVGAVVPGAVGRILAALGRVEAELSVSTLARVAGVGRTRASGIVGQLSDLGIVERKEVGRTVLVTLNRRNAAGQLIAKLSNLYELVIEDLRILAAQIDPAPASLSIFGSFARGTARADSDIDVIAIRPAGPDEEAWSESLFDFLGRVRELTGNPVQVIEYDIKEISNRGDEIGHEFWTAVQHDAVVLTGTHPSELPGGSAGTAGS